MADAALMSAESIMADAKALRLWGFVGSDSILQVLKGFTGGFKYFWEELLGFIWFRVESGLGWEGCRV